MQVYVSWLTINMTTFVMIEMLKIFLHEKDVVLVDWTAESSMAPSRPIEFPNEDIICIQKEVCKEVPQFYEKLKPNFNQIN